MCIKIENRRYTGSKAKLTNWIFEIIEKECKGSSFADIFAGTGVVSAAAAKRYNKLIINDFLYSNNVIYKAFFGKGSVNLQKLEKTIQEYNLLQPRSLPSNYFSKNFGGKYYSLDNAKKIGYIRQDIDRKKKIFSGKEVAILLTSLLYAADKIANTVGHYDAYIRKQPFERVLKMALPECIFTKSVEIYKEDANKLAKKIKSDIVYIDPPYNSRQYSRFYHLLENLVKWEQPQLFGTALKPVTENASEYSKSNAPKVFEDLIQSLDCRYIVVSYNNTYSSKSHSSRNKITLEEIKLILEKKGKTKSFKTKHKFFNTGKTDFANHQEWLFITKVYA